MPRLFVWEEQDQACEWRLTDEISLLCSGFDTLSNRLWDSVNKGVRSTDKLLRRIEQC